MRIETDDTLRRRKQPNPEVNGFTAYIAKSKIHVETLNADIEIKRGEQFYLRESRGKFFFRDFENGLTYTVGISEVDHDALDAKHKLKKPLVRTQIGSGSWRKEAYDRMEEKMQAVRDAYGKELKRITMGISKVLMTMKSDYAKGNFAPGEEAQMKALIDVLELMVEKGNLGWKAKAPELDKKIARAEVRLKAAGGTNPFKLV
jgi:hypothetical protein